MRTLGRRHLIGLGATLAIAPPAFAGTGPLLALWKHPGCSCCTDWARSYQDAGFVVVLHEVADLAPARAAGRVPDDLAGCHTAFVGDYVIEGHVPVAAVLRLLAERPSISGLAVPGMPIGSPGMEVAGVPAEPYDVVAFSADGIRFPFG
jgi:hypothetical protein